MIVLSVHSGIGSDGLSLFSLASTEGFGQEIRAVERISLPPTSRSTAKEREGAGTEPNLFFFSSCLYDCDFFFFKLI